MIEQQGGDPRVLDDPSRLPAAPARMILKAERSGFVTQLDAETIGHAACVLGAGREHAADVVDPGVGAIVRVRVGDAVKVGDPLVELLYRDEWKCTKAREMIRSACQLGDSPSSQSALIYEVIE
jgi:thymidine phosphorylase